MVGLEPILEVCEELFVPLRIGVHIFDEQIVHLAIIELYAINQSICVPESEETAAARFTLSFLERKILPAGRHGVLRYGNERL